LIVTLLVISPGRTRRTHLGALALAVLCSFPLAARAQTASPPPSEAPPAVTVTPAPTRETPPAPDAPAAAPAAAPTALYVATMKDKTDPGTNWTSSAFSVLFSRPTTEADRWGR
jgi:hypothetical protein